MALQLSVEQRNARLDVVETTLGASPTLRIRSGAPPATTATARTGTVLATITLPADWANAAASGSKTMLGTWADGNGADATGTAGYFDITTSGSRVDMQGTVTGPGGGGDMEVSNTSFVLGQPFDITTFTLNEPNA
jgi:hypothetical protein